MKVYATQGDTVDDLCFRHYGRSARVVEQVYEANPGLAEAGPVLRHGQPVELPDAPAATTTETITLWS